MISRPARWSSKVSMRRTATPSAPGGSSVSTIAAATGSHGGSGSRQPSALQAFGQRRRLRRRADVPEGALDVADQSEDLVGDRGDGSWIVRDSQMADAGPAPLGADRDAVPVVDDPLRTLGRVDMKVGILRELGQRRDHRAGRAM